ncbi:MAG: nitroreductase family protein [Ignavibacteriales bacterium]
MEEIFKRRSIREYTDEVISDEDIKLIIKAGMNAPSAHNMRPTYYVVVNDKDKLKELSIINKYGKMLEHASHAIVVCAKEATDFWFEDASASTLNILLQATSLNIGSCWVGLYPTDTEKKVKECLNIPNDVRAFSIVSLGYPLKERNINDFYEEDRIKHNMWK